MAAPKRPTHVVVHKRLYMKGEKGKLVHFPAGTQLTLSDEQAKKMGKMVKSLKDGETVDLTSEDDKKADKKASAGS